MSNFLDNYLRKDSSGSNIYYGYSSRINPSDSDPVWSIRLVSGTSSETVTWSNGNPILQISIWDNRLGYFTSSSSLNLTYSVGTYSSGSRYISLGWDNLNGVDIYKLEISNGSQLYNENGQVVYKNANFDNDPSIRVYNKNEYKWGYAESGKTYSVVLSSYNVVDGWQSEAANIYVH